MDEKDRIVWISTQPKVKANIHYLAPMRDNENLNFVLDILWYTGINFELTTKSAYETILRGIISIVYVIGTAYSFSIRLYAFVSYNSGAMIVTELIALSCSVSLWISINLKKHKIVNLKVSINNILSGMERNKSSRRKSYLIKCLCFTTITLPFFTGAISTVISKVKLENIDNYLGFLAFGLTLNIGLHIRYTVLFLLRSYDLSICFVSSQISCLLFSVLCYNVSLYVRKCKTQFVHETQGGNLSVETFIKRYKKVKRRIRELENAISQPMFFALAFLLCEVFALMSNAVSIFRSKSSIASLVIVLSALCATSLYVISIIFQASSVEEVHKSLIRAFIEFPEDDVRNVRELLSVMKLITSQDTLHITAWGMFPVKRGFFLTIVGTLTTYGVLLVQFT